MSERDEVAEVVKEYLSADIIDLRQRLGLDKGPGVELGPRPNVATMSAPILALCDVDPADYLFEDMLSTTMRWLCIGDTGVGKTLIWFDACHALANAAQFLTWKAVRPAKIAYFDGELPFETVRKRINTSQSLFGPAPAMTIYTRDILAQDGIEMPPFDTEEGQAWLWRELETEHYDLACFDSIGTLTKNIMAEEEGWRAMSPMINRISALRCAQVWLHHTGHNAAHGYGTKTREWNMDAVIMLAKADPADPDSDVELKFTKARHRTPETAHLYKTITLRRDQLGWNTGDAPKATGSLGVGQRKRAWFLEALDELASGAPVGRGHAGEPVHKVAISAIRDRMLNRGHLDVDDNGKITGAERTALTRIKQDLVAAGIITIENKTTTWRIK